MLQVNDLQLVLVQHQCLVHQLLLPLRRYVIAHVIHLMNLLLQIALYGLANLLQRPLVLHQSIYQVILRDLCMLLQ